MKAGLQQQSWQISYLAEHRHQRWPSLTTLDRSFPREAVKSRNCWSIYNRAHQLSNGAGRYSQHTRRSWFAQSRSSQRARSATWAQTAWTPKSMPSTLQ